MDLVVLYFMLVYTRRYEGMYVYIYIYIYIYTYIYVYIYTHTHKYMPCMAISRRDASGSCSNAVCTDRKKWADLSVTVGDGVALCVLQPEVRSLPHILV